MKNRQAFNFYRSYYDVIVELPDEQKLPLLMAILNKQFLDIEPNLTGIPALLYKSQKHSIEKQVNGYKAKMGITTPSQGPTEGPSQGPTEANKEIEAITKQGPYQPPCQGPSVQEEGEGQGEEEEQVQGEEQEATIAQQTRDEEIKRKYNIGEDLKKIFNKIPNVTKLIDRDDLDPIQRSCTQLFNEHYQTILEYKSIKI
jgi:hypothetical protein